MTAFTLRMLRNTGFPDLYKKLLLGEELSSRQLEALLKIAVIFVNAGDGNVQNLGYRVILMYCNSREDYEPLYDVAMSKGYIPVAKAIERKSEYSDYFDGAFFNTLLSSLGETYKDKDKEIYHTSQQVQLSEFFNQLIDWGVAVVAPTSYGKSELFINFCNKNESETIVILVPTKALLSQMKRRVLHGRIQGSIKRKIITHPEMYNKGDTGFIAILTQERLLRILQDDPGLSFDYVFVDEAHNLLSGDPRNLLLAKVIALLGDRSKATSISYLTPFLMEPSNLSVKYSENVFDQFRISEHLKSERYFVADLRESGEHVLKI